MTRGSDSREDVWQVREQDFPLTGLAQEQLRFLVRYAVLAPFGHNSQPWRFETTADEIRVLADTDRWLRVVDPHQRELHLAVGCALENLLVAAEHFGFGHQVAFFPSPADRPDLVASVKLTAPNVPSPWRGPELFGALVARHTNRRVYQGRPIPEGDFQRLRACGVEEGVWLRTIDGEARRRQVKDLLIRGHAISLGDPGFRRETADWIGRGIFAMPWLLAKLAQWTLPYVDFSPAVAVFDARQVMSASAVVVLGSDSEGRESQVKVGQVFERICLLATALGICVHPMSPLVEYPELRDEVARPLPVSTGILQHAFRLGYAKPVRRPAPRRPLREVFP